MRGKVQIYPRCPATAWLLLKMRLRETADVPTMAVDMAGNLYWNAAWVATLTEAQLMGGLRHETWHQALLHFERTGTRNRELSNICQDLVVNAMCVQDGFELPPHGLIPAKDDTFTFKFNGLAPDHTVEHISTREWEDLYAELWPLWPKRWAEGEGQTGQTKGKTGGKNGAGKAKSHGGPPKGFDSHDYSKNSTTPEEWDRRERENRARLGEAVQVAKSMGQLPASLERLVDHLLTPKLPWRQLLQKFVQQWIPSDYTFRRPSRRGLASDLYLPSVLKETVHILIYMDTSGSMGPEERAEAASEVYAALCCYPNVEAEVVMCDAEVHNVEVLTSASAERIKAIPFTGGGGTSHRPVLEWTERERPDTKLAIGFTDGHSDINDCPPPPFPVIWVISSHGVDPKDIKWGDVIKMEDN